MGGSGIWALDIDRAGEDHKGDGVAAMARLTRKHGPLPAGPVTRSGGGGYAVFFRDTGDEITGRTGHPAPGIDPRAPRMTVTVPPSIHLRTRQPYRWITAPWDIKPPAAPAWLLEAVRPPPEPPAPVYHREAADRLSRVALDRAIARVSGAGSGQGNRALWSAAHVMGGWVAAGSIAEGEVAAALYHAAKSRGGSSDHREISGTIKSGLSSGKRRPMELRA